MNKLLVSTVYATRKAQLILLYVIVILFQGVQIMELFITQIFQSPVASSLLFPNFSPATSFQTPMSTIHTRLMVRDQVLNVQYKSEINPLKPEINSICYLLALLGAHHFLHVSRIRVKLLTFRLLM